MSASAAFIQTGIGIAGIGLLVSVDAAPVKPGLVAFIVALGWVFFLLVIGLGLFALYRHRRLQERRARLSHIHWQLQAKIYGWERDPTFAKMCEAELRNRRDEADAEAKKLHGNPWVAAEYVALMAAFALLAARPFAGFL